VKKRGNGLGVWEFRHYEPLPDGNGRGLRAVTVFPQPLLPAFPLFESSGGMTATNQNTSLCYVFRGQTPGVAGKVFYACCVALPPALRSCRTYLQFDSAGEKACH
jgi:hypothetical protein